MTDHQTVVALRKELSEIAAMTAYSVFDVSGANRVLADVCLKAARALHLDKLPPGQECPENLYHVMRLLVNAEEYKRKALDKSPTSC